MSPVGSLLMWEWYLVSSCGYPEATRALGDASHSFHWPPVSLAVTLFILIPKIGLQAGEDSGMALVYPVVGLISISGVKKRGPLGAIPPSHRKFVLRAGGVGGAKS